MLPVGVGEDFGVSLVHPNLTVTSRPRRGLHRARVDLVVHLHPAATQDEPQRPRWGHRSVQRDTYWLTTLQAGHSQPHVASLCPGERAVLVRTHHDLIVSAVAAMLP